MRFTMIVYYDEVLSILSQKQILKTIGTFVRKSLYMNILLLNIYKDKQLRDVVLNVMLIVLVDNYLWCCGFDSL